ncbi:MAG: protein kinase [Planctomycetia bacterium]|nr:protein kinase [Planctomycetia bacterium]
MNDANEEKTVPDNDARLFEILEQYMDKPASQLPTREEITAKYPKLARQIWQCLEGMAIMRGECVDSTFTGSVSTTGKTAKFHAVAEDVPVGDVSVANSEPIGDFQILREIGRGGMGVVYEARQCSLGRLVAVKVLPFASTFDPRQLQRFHNEATAAAQLEHPSIVPIYAVGCERGIHYYAMRLINGQHLGTLIRQLQHDNHISDPVSQTSQSVRLDEPTTEPAGGSTTEPVAFASTQISRQYTNDRRSYYRSVARMMKQAAEALDYAHQCGVIHRDIKPGNLLVDTGGRLWITDFGLAHICSSTQLTQTGEVFGTPRYMSPEQATGKVHLVDHRADIYSLGATFYEFLTLHPLFDEKNQVQLLRRIVQEEPPQPHVYDPHIPRDLETILLKTLEKNVTDRYETAGALAGDLERFLDDMPIRAKRPGMLDICRKFLRRHPSVILSVLLLIAASYVVLLVNRQMISAEQKKTTAALTEAQNRFEKARQAADALINIAENDLNDGSPAVKKARQKLLDTALVLYQDFLSMDSLDEETQQQLESGRNYLKRFLQVIAQMEGMPSLFLLGERPIQDELQLSETQRRDVRQFMEQMGKRGEEVFRKISNQEDRLEHLSAALKEGDTFLDALLTPQQAARLEQIRFQVQPECILNDDAVKKLKLTSEQVENLTRMFTYQEVNRRYADRTMAGPPPMSHGKKTDNFRTGNPDGPREIPSEGKSWKEFHTSMRLENILTEEQKKIWKEMTGEPFFFKKSHRNPDMPPPPLKSRNFPPKRKLGIDESR